jgi:uncharacterized protein involved in exopolysaccharide biosynthesis/Mrp family chromosome partitioning ATPase
MNLIASHRMKRVGPEWQHKEKTPREVYFILFRHKMKVMSFLVLVMLAAILGAVAVPDVYVSTSKLIVRLGRESVGLDPTATTGRVVTVGQERENEINSELEIINSRELSEKVVDTLGPRVILDAANDPPLDQNSLPLRLRYELSHALRSGMTIFGGSSASCDPLPAQTAIDRERGVQLLIKSLKVEAIKKSNIVQISFESRNPRLAHDVVEKLIGFYLDKHIYAHRTSGSYGFFSEQRDALRSEVGKTEQALKNLKAETGMSSLQEQRRILLERTGSLQRDLEQSESGMDASAAKIKALKAALASVPSVTQKEETTGFAGSAADELLKRLQELRLKEQELLSTYTPTSVPVVEIRRQIKEAQALMMETHQTRQVTRSINLTYKQLELDSMTEEGNYSSLLAKSQVLKQQLSNARKELMEVNESEVKLADLERELEIQKANYLKYTESLEQARIDQALEMEKISNINVFQPPSLPVKPDRPNRLLSLVLGALFGVIGGLGLAFVAEYLDHSFKQPEDVEERLRLPALAAIPLWGSNGRGSSVPVLPDIAQSADGEIKGAEKHLLELKELYEALIERLGAREEENRGSAPFVALTSCRQGEGSSTVAAHLALLLASRGEGRVLLVDANLQHPSVHRTFGVSISPGLADIVAIDSACATLTKPSGLANLDLLCSGKAEDGLAWLFESRNFALLLSLWRREYSFVVFDTPAFWEGSHPICLYSAVDAVILVVEAERVRWETAQRARDRLVDSGANVFGVVLNKRRFHVPDWLYQTL